MEGRAIGVVVVEEQGLFRGGLRTVLEGGGFRLAGEYEGPEAALADESVGELEPGTVVLCSMSVGGWEEMAHRMALQTPESRIVGVVDEVDDGTAMEALSAGMVGCLSRSLSPDEWVERVREAHAGTLSASRTVTRYVGTARQILVSLSQTAEPRGLATLSPQLGHRERLALAGVSEGVSAETIGERMGVTEGGVYEVLESACRKLVVRRRLEGVLERVR